MSKRIISCNQNFNPRSRVGNDYFCTIVKIHYSTFQSTFPRGERPDTGIRSAKSRNFNPRSRVGNDDQHSDRQAGYVGISIHVPAWGTTVNGLIDKIATAISIHVPAWGTTILGSDLIEDEQISIHVPAWGTTEDDVPDTTPVADFNPRSRVGNDKAATNMFCQARYISIHVPAWGTTQGAMRKADGTANFNPRSRVGNDMAACVNLSLFKNFNPRSRVGNDHAASCSAFRLLYFNPRSRVGNDQHRKRSFWYFLISIHVPAWGTTTGFQFVTNILNISIHVPAWGTTYF